MIRIKIAVGKGMPCIVKRTSPAKSVKKKKTFRTVLVRVWYLNIFKKFADKDVNNKRQEIISQG